MKRQVARINGVVQELPLKTKNSYRTIPLSEDTVAVLRAQKEKTHDAYVFPSPNGGPISPDSVRNMLKRVLERAGLPDVRFHDLRHTFATLALQNGVDIKTVSGMLGRRSPVETVLRRPSRQARPSPPASPWTPTPMSPPAPRRRPPTRSEGC